MKCPHCEYLDGYNYGTNQEDKGDEGPFYRLSNSIHMERENYCLDHQRVLLCGCPRCKKVFIDDL